MAPRLRSRKLLLLVGALAALLTLILGDAARNGTGSDPRRVAAAKPSIDAAEVVDATRHRVTPVQGGLAATDEAYRLDLDETGFELQPTDRSSRLGVALSHIESGGRDITFDAGAWQRDANRARRRVTPTVSEVVTAADGEIEWDLVLDAPPVGTGAFSASAAVTGVQRVSVEPDALRFELAGGGDLRMGELVVKDAIGVELYRDLPQVNGGQLRLEVPKEVLVGARYPVTLDPTVSPERVATVAPTDQFEPEVTFDGNNTYFVVWTDQRNGNDDIYGTRVRADGLVLDPDGILISTSASQARQFQPVVVWIPSYWLVVWTDERNGNRDIYGARLRPNGTVLDVIAAPIGAAPATQMDPAIAFNGTDHLLIVWSDFRFGDWDVIGTRFTLQAGVVDPAGFLIGAGGWTEVEPAVTFSGSNYLVAWQDDRNGGSDIYGKRVSTDGVVLDSPAAPISTAPDSQFGVDLAFDGQVVLVVWEDLRAGTRDIYGARWSPTSGLIDSGGIPIAAHGSQEREPSVVANGGFLVVWIDIHEGPAADLYGARVKGNGSVSDPNGFPVSAVAGDELHPALARGKGDAWAVGYTRVVGDDDANVFFRTVKPK